MNHSPFWPLVWKEYRVGRAFWLAMAIMGLVAQGGVAWLAHQSADRNWWLYGIALMISAGFAVGIGGTLFAVEHEERTFGLLRVLPVRANELGWAKVLCALTSLLSLVVALWLAAAAMAGWQMLSPSDAGRLWGLWGLACAEGLAWGILCSLVIRSPLRATVTAVLAVTLTVQAAVSLTTTHSLAEIVSYSEAIPLRLALLVLVVLADVWLLPRWLAGRVPHASVQRPTAKGERRAKAYAAWSSPAPRWWVPLSHLMWHAWREVVASVWLLAGAAVVSLLVAMFVLATLNGVLHLGQQWLNPPIVLGLRMLPWFALLPFVLVTCLSGSLVFRVDPTSGARFLAERGVSSRLLWIARQIVWGGWILVLFLAAACLSIVLGFFDSPRLPIDQDYDAWIAMARQHNFPEAMFRFTGREVALNALLVCGVLFSAFAMAQLVSLIVRRRLLAAVFSVFLGTLAAGWAYLMFAIDVPWWWSVLPLGAGCLLATWLRTPAWLLARTDWRGWILPVAAIAGPVALLAIAVPSYRAEELPAFLPRQRSNDPPATRIYWSEEDNSPAAIADVKAALALYQRAYDVYLALRHETDQQAAFDLVVEASRHRSTWLPDDPQASWRVATPLHELGHWLPGWANACRIRGQRDQALEAYLAALRVANHFDESAGLSHAHEYDLSMRSRALEGLRSWAGAAEQTPEQLREAIRQLDESHVPELTAEARLRSWYYATRFAITDFPATLSDDGKPQGFTSECWISSELPWERQRALHLASFIASVELDTFRKMENQLSWQNRAELATAEGSIPLGRTRELRGPWLIDGFLTPLFRTDPWDWSRYRMSDDRFPEANQWLRTTPLVTELALRVLPTTWSLVAEETDFRATKIVLALEAWQLEHRQLPVKLEELVPSELAFVPVDPVFGEQFLYYPQGMAEPPDNRILLTAPAELSDEQKEFYEHRWPPRVIDWPAIGRKPFLWSALGPIPGVQPVAVDKVTYASQPIAMYYYVDRSRDQGWHVQIPENSVLQAGQAYVISQAEEKQP